MASQGLTVDQLGFVNKYISKISDTGGRAPISVVAFQRSRIMWLDAKAGIKRELGALQDAIIAQAAGDESEAEIRAAAGEIAGRIDLIDSRLEDVLDDITNAAPGPAREGHRKRAVSVIREYTALLDTATFQMLDANPFKSVAVTGPAKQSLATIARMIA